MSVIVSILPTDQQDRTFLTWSPSPATARLAAPGLAPLEVVLSNENRARGGQAAFYASQDAAEAETLQLRLPADGSPAAFWISGQFQRPSTDYGDGGVIAKDLAGAIVARRSFMVRVRKDAQALMPGERDRFLIALAKLNQAGKGPFKAFRDMHVLQSAPEAHGGPAFLPWHRAYLLDLERELQGIDPSVALPYWRFDRPAPALFSSQFLGMPSPDPAQGDLIDLPTNHPLLFWSTDGVTGMVRRPRFDIAGAPPSHSGVDPLVISEEDTLRLSDAYEGFVGLEGAPHGYAHTSFRGPVSSVPTAAKDPLFFLLHANVDRLWAKWQWFYQRHRADAPEAYKGKARAGHRLDDTMWPWNGDTRPPRPTFPPPGGGFADSPITAAPGTMPTVRSMIDYQAVTGGEALGFDYDDVPFER